MGAPFWRGGGGRQQATLRHWGQVARKCCSSSINGSKNGRCDCVSTEDRSIFYNTSSIIYCLFPVWSDISGFC